MKLGQTTIQIHKRAGFDDVGHRLGFTTGARLIMLDNAYMTITKICVTPMVDMMCSRRYNFNNMNTNVMTSGSQH